MKRFIPLLLTVFTAAALGGVPQDHPKKTAIVHRMISLPTVKCDLCAETVQKSAQKVAGVQSVTVDLGNKTAHVAFDSTKTSLAAIEKAVSAAGYDAGAVKRDPKAYAGLPKCCR
jgi:periplasmic mercuric ion binding protein